MLLGTDSCWANRQQEGGEVVALVEGAGLGVEGGGHFLEGGAGV